VEGVNPAPAPQACCFFSAGLA